MVLRAVFSLEFKTFFRFGKGWWRWWEQVAFCKGRGVLPDAGGAGGGEGCPVGTGVAAIGAVLL